MEDLVVIMTDLEKEIMFETIRRRLLVGTLLQAAGDLEQNAIEKLNCGRELATRLIAVLRLPGKHPRLIRTANASLAVAEQVNMGILAFVPDTVSVLRSYIGNEEKGTLSAIAKVLYRRYKTPEEMRDRKELEEVFVYEMMRDELESGTLAEMRRERSAGGIRKLNVQRVFTAKLIETIQRPRRNKRLIEIAEESLTPAELIKMGLHQLVPPHEIIPLLSRYISEEKGTLSQIARHIYNTHYQHASIRLH